MKEGPAFGLVPANGLLVIDDDYSILIGTAWTDDQTASIPNWARLTLKEAGKTGSLYLCTRRQNGRVGIVQKRDVQTYALALSN